MEKLKMERFYFVTFKTAPPVVVGESLGEELVSALGELGSFDPDAFLVSPVPGLGERADAGVHFFRLAEIVGVSLATEKNAESEFDRPYTIILKNGTSVLVDYEFASAVIYAWVNEKESVGGSDLNGYPGEGPDFNLVGVPYPDRVGWVLLSEVVMVI